MPEGPDLQREQEEVAVGVLRRLSLGLGARGTRWMVVGAAIAALGAYLFQALGTRTLGGVGYAPIGTLWTIQYLIVSVVLLPIETHIARESILSHAAGLRSPRVSFARLWGWLALVAIVASSVCWLLRDELFHGLNDLALVIGALVLSYGAFLIVRGRLAGTERFKAYGVVTASESMVRAILAAAVTSFALGVRAFAWIMPLGALTAAGWWVPLRRNPRQPRDVATLPVEPPRTARFLALTTTANAITQLLLAGGPLLLAFLHATPEEVSVFFVTTTAVRVPLLFAFGGVLSRLLPTFMRLESSDRRREARAVAAKIALGTVSVAVVIGGVAAAVGAPLVAVLFGAAFRPPWWLAAGATVGVLLATGSVVLYQLLIARGSAGLGLLAWAVALVASVLAVLLTDGSATTRAVAGLVTGEAVALIALVLAASMAPGTAPRGDAGQRADSFRTGGGHSLGLGET
jgi:O-antigen/teichoic acid export membrane protein